MITTYEQIPAQASRTGPCPGCGKKTRRDRTFTQTVNPWNTIEENGVKRPKTRAEVGRAVWDEAAAWAPDPEVFRHARCVTVEARR